MTPTVRMLDRTSTRPRAAPGRGGAPRVPGHLYTALRRQGLGWRPQTATPKQISFLISLGARNKLTFQELQRIAQERFPAEDLYRLSKQQASEMIDSLKPEPARR